jgi:hypothetical protein
MVRDKASEQQMTTCLFEHRIVLVEKTRLMQYQLAYVRLRQIPVFGKVRRPVFAHWPKFAEAVSHPRVTHLNGLRQIADPLGDKALKPGVKTHWHLP